MKAKYGWGITTAMVMVVSAGTISTVQVHRNTKEYRQAMNAYRASHLICEWDLRNTGIEVHHIIPVHVDPTKAVDTNNMASLCPRCHFTVGPLCNFKTGHVPNLKEVIQLRTIGSTNKIVKGQ